MAASVKPSRTSRSATTVRIVLLSDTHQLHREADVPDGDLLIHAGDFTMFSRSANAISDFNTWLGELTHRHKVIVPGNHEFFLEEDLSGSAMLDNATVLINEGVEIAGLKIWGSPVTPLSGGAFGLSSAEEREQLYSRIPEDVDILITHGPPLGILDSTPGSGVASGCQELLDAVMRTSPKLHVFGHVHGAYGVFETPQTIFVNAALLGIDGDLDRRPIVLQMTAK